MVKTVTAKKITTLTQELLTYLGLPKAKVKASSKEGEVKVEIEAGEEAGILIGYHGEILEALQLILSLLTYRQAGTWQRIAVNVNDYLKVRRQQLETLASKVVQEVYLSQKSQALPYLSANERRLVHEFLAESQEVTTESVGESRQRRLVISPK